MGREIVLHLLELAVSGAFGSITGSTSGTSSGSTAASASTASSDFTIILIIEVSVPGESGKFGSFGLSDGVHHVGGHKVLDLGGLTLLGGSGGDFLSFLNSGGLGAELGVILLSGHAGFVFSVVLTVDGIFIAGIVSFLTGSSLVF